MKKLLIIMTLLTLPFHYLYFKKENTSLIAQTIIQRLNKICNEQNIIPSKDDFQSILNEFKVNDQERWHYFLQNDQKTFYIQYPVNFWNINAIGKAKLSEFIPLPYAYSVKVQCL